MTKRFEWNEDKNKLLKIYRNISFEDVIKALESGRQLNIEDHHNKKKYGNQKIFIVEIGNYAYIVPFIEDEEKVFLKTIYPSRKATKKYIKNEKIN